MRRTKTRPGGRPAGRRQEEHAQANKHGTRAWRPPTGKGSCRRPHETAPLHRPRPLSNDGLYRKPDASVTGLSHANHGSARGPKLTPEGPARNIPFARPRTSTARSEPSAPASAATSGRQNEPGSGPASARPAQPPSKSRGEGPRGGEGHQRVRKANWSTESDQTGRGAAHHAGPRSTPERQAAGHNQGTRIGAKRQRPPGAANVDGAHNTQRTTARKHLPPSRCTSADVAANPAPPGYEKAAVRIDVCAPGGYTAPAGYETAAVRIDVCAPGGFTAHAGYEKPCLD